MVTLNTLYTQVVGGGATTLTSAFTPNTSGTNTIPVTNSRDFPAATNYVSLIDGGYVATFKYTAKTSTSFTATLLEYSNNKGSGTNGSTHTYATSTTSVVRVICVKDMSDIQTNLTLLNNNKVEVVSGKGLSTNDYTNAEKTLVATISNKVNKDGNKVLSTNDFTNALKTKLNGIATGAEVNVQSDWSTTDTTSDSYILNKPTQMTPTNHSSIHSASGRDPVYISESQVTNLVNDLSNKVNKDGNKVLSTNDFTNALKTKLDGIESGAEVNIQSDWSITNIGDDAYIKNKPSQMTPSNHASIHSADGRDPVSISESQVINLTSDLGAKVDKVTGYTLTKNNYTDDDKTIVSNVESQIATINVSLNNKVNSAQGMGLSSNDFNGVLKTKLESLTNADWDSTSGYSKINNKPFDTIGAGLTVQNGALCANARITYAIFTTLPTPSSTYANTIGLVKNQSSTTYTQYVCVQGGDIWQWVITGSTDYKIPVVSGTNLIL